MDFHEWTETFSQQELRSLINERLKMDLGAILSLEPMEQGPGGHISRLRIVGSERTFIVGKELEIRRTLSSSHLKSSAFRVEALNIENGIPQQFRLHGKGWGHGVGMCQIGAAVMGEKGFTYRQILSHYYSGTDIQQVYE
jgi:SpoIID/LytB domain protein